jgi:hypothetical protein
MKRMSNVNSFSAIIDRLIIENLKIIQFVDQNKLEEAEQQNVIISELKTELNLIYQELLENRYKSIGEQRTYTNDNLFSDLFRLCLNNYCIAKGDKLKVEESKKGIVNVDMLKNYINAVRENLEERSKSKNNLENIK